jgi:hypothetical protein
MSKRPVTDEKREKRNINIREGVCLYCYDLALRL